MKAKEKPILSKRRKFY